MSLCKKRKKKKKTYIYLTLPIFFAVVLHRPPYSVSKIPKYLLHPHMCLSRNIYRVFVTIPECGIRYATNKLYIVLVRPTGFSL
jgi:hypothetical protein